MKWGWLDGPPLEFRRDKDILRRRGDWGGVCLSLIRIYLLFAPAP